MDPQELEQRKQQARNEGYSEEEINAALGITAPATAAGPAPMQSGPIAPDPELDRSAEQNTTLATGAALGAAGIGVPAAIGYGIKAGLSGAANKGAQVMDVAKQGVSALQQQAQTAQMAELRKQQRPGFGGNPMPQANPAAVAATAQAAQTAQAMTNPNAQNYLQRMSAMASRYAPVAGKIASSAGPATAMAMNLFGTSPEEIATLKAAEERKRQAMMQQPR